MIPIAQLDAFVSQVVLLRLGKSDINMWLNDSDPDVVAAQMKLKRLRDKLDLVFEEWRVGRLSEEGYADMDAELRARIAIAHRELDHAVALSSIEVPTAEDLETWWDEIAPKDRRDLIAALVSRIVVGTTDASRDAEFGHDVDVKWSKARRTSTGGDDTTESDSVQPDIDR